MPLTKLLHRTRPARVGCRAISMHDRLATRRGQTRSRNRRAATADGRRNATVRLASGVRCIRARVGDGVPRSIGGTATPIVRGVVARMGSNGVMTARVGRAGLERFCGHGRCAAAGDTYCSERYDPGERATSCHRPNSSPMSRNRSKHPRNSRRALRARS
jgi:hypothetical protein